MPTGDVCRDLRASCHMAYRHIMRAEEMPRTDPRPHIRSDGFPLAGSNLGHLLDLGGCAERSALTRGENIKALPEYLGHSGPSFTLRTYTHLVPTSHDRTREAVDRALYQEHAIDGPGTAQISD